MMPRLYNFIVICYAILHECVHGFNTVLNIEELNSIHYNVDIVKKPVLKVQNWKTDTVTVVNKHGQEYICSLPKVEIPEREYKKEEDILDQLVDITELLKPMESAPCLIKKKDWWTYEFCYGSVIKQYHLEENKVAGAILILGRYESEYNWKNSSETKNKLQKFHSQFYVNGTRCDLTSEARRTEVRFHCEEGVGDYIQQVEEPESCRYVVIIATTRACHHPYLKPNPNKNPHNITCAPSLSEDEFSKYQKLQIKKKIIAEKNRKEGLHEGKNVESLDEEGESRLSIQLVTFPISKPERMGKLFQDEGTFEPEQVAEETMGVGSVEEVTSDDIEVVEDFHIPKEIIKERLQQNLDEVNSGESSGKLDDLNKLPPVDDSEVLDRGISNLIMSLHNSEKVNEEEGEDSKKKRQSTIKTLKQIRDMNKMMGKFMLSQTKDQIKELTDKITKNLDGSIHRLQKAASKYPDEALMENIDEILKIATKYKKQVEDRLGELKLSDEQQMMDVLNTLTAALMETEEESFEGKKLLEKLMKEKSEVEEPKVPEDSPQHDRESNLPSQPYTKVPTTNSEPQSEIGEGSSIWSSNEDGDKEDTDEKPKVDSKTLNEMRETKLEQSIKEKLQKSGLDNLGRKIEVKILTTNYLEDEDKDSLSSLSQEETEAFHNMIVNILSANAEEIQEKERQQHIESSYNFQINEIYSDLEEKSDSQEDKAEEEDKITHSTENNDDSNNNDKISNDQESGR